MQQYLVYDANCSVCSELATAVRRLGGQKLRLLSIHGAEARELLDRAYPQGWGFAPHLIAADHRRIRAWTGIGAGLRLARLLGPRNAWHLWTVARRRGVLFPSSAGQPNGRTLSRRYFLKVSAGVTAALVGAGLLPSGASVSAYHPCEPCCRDHGRVFMKVGCSRDIHGCVVNYYDVYDASNWQFCYSTYIDCGCDGTCQC